MASFVYILCAVASFGCAVLQFRTYIAGRTRFLLWTTVCFASIFVNNLLLYVDAMTGPSLNLAMPRTLILMAGLGALIYGFIWEIS